MISTKTTLLAAVVVALGCSVQAATVKFTLDVSTPGAFNLLAEELDGDNGGIASYGAVITGGVTSLQHVSTFSQFAISPNGNGPIGFTQLRSGADVAAVGASQDTITPSPNLIFGVGQTADSFGGLGYNDATGTATGTDWGVPYLIATGTWEGDELGFNAEDARTFSNIFVDQGTAQTRAAELLFEVVGGDTDPVLSGEVRQEIDLGGGMISMQGAFDSLSGEELAAIMVMIDPDAGDLTIDDLIITNDTNGLFGASVNGGDGSKIDLTIDLAAAQQLPPGTFVSADLEVVTNYGNLVYQLKATVPEPSSVALAGLALVGLVGVARRRLA